MKVFVLYYPSDVTYFHEGQDLESFDLAKDIISELVNQVRSGKNIIGLAIPEDWTLDMIESSEITEIPNYSCPSVN